mmetsp:Transcript_51084/g.123292  ORF Transcript_51084/g.123292 Transcript_51084/m.123292 type:complete len:266 (-) Transcript_51084:302-1099(-)
MSRWRGCGNRSWFVRGRRSRIRRRRRWCGVHHGWEWRLCLQNWGPSWLRCRFWSRVRCRFWSRFRSWELCGSWRRIRSWELCRSWSRLGCWRRWRRIRHCREWCLCSQNWGLGWLRCRFRSWSRCRIRRGEVRRLRSWFRRGVRCRFWCRFRRGVWCWIRSGLDKRWLGRRVRSGDDIGSWCRFRRGVWCRVRSGLDKRWLRRRFRSGDDIGSWCRSGGTGFGDWWLCGWSGTSAHFGCWRGSRCRYWWHRRRFFTSTNDANRFH